MDREEFESLETVNIQLDVLIDEEQYEQVKSRILLRQGDGTLVEDPETPAALEEVLQFDSVLVSVLEPELGEYSTDAEDLRTSWAALLLVKRLRAALQSLPHTPDGSLERLAIYVVSRLPSVCAAQKDTEDEDAQFRDTLALLYLNEICACYGPELSVGFAKQALDRIGWPQGLNAYELLALLNRGVGYAHVHRHDDALADLAQVIEECERWDEGPQSHYVPEDGHYQSGRIDLQDGESRTLWIQYVYVPAVLHKAEVLSDLNRSTEQLPVLQKLNNAPSDYANKRRTLLEVLARMDASLWSRDGDGNPVLDDTDIDAIEAWGAEANEEARYSLRQKCRQVLCTYKLKHLDRSATSRDTTPLNDFEPLEDQLEQFKEGSSDLGDDEINDAYLLWIDYYELYLSYKDSVEHIDNGDVERLAECAERLVDHPRFPDREKSRERLLKILGKVGDNRPELKNRHVEVLRKMVLNGHSVPLWRKTTAARQLETLGAELGDYTPLRLPDPDQTASVVSRAKDAFCSDGCPTRDNPGSGACTSKLCRTSTYQQVLESNRTRFLSQLLYPSLRPQSLSSSYCLTVLRRWQSFTPALATGAIDDSRGGGYFVYRTDEDSRVIQGVVVDPGFDFVENFLGQGFSVHDIDAVVMTHAHVDHTADFPRLLTLVVEYNKRRDKNTPQKRLLALMSRGCFERFEKSIAGSYEQFSDVVVIDPGEGVPPVPIDSEWSGYLRQLQHFRFEGRYALHNDTTPYDSVGIAIHGVKGDGEEVELVGFTGDTMWWADAAQQHAGAPTLCANIGGIVPYGKNYGDSSVTIPDHLLEGVGARRVVLEENHLYWPGFSLLTNALGSEAKLVIVTEMGEELKGGLRTDLAKRLNTNPARRYVPEDIGLTVKLGDSPEIYCCACGRTVPPEDADFRSHGREESIYYVCKPCQEYRDEAVREAIVDLHDNGWPRNVDTNWPQEADKNA